MACLGLYVFGSYALLCAISNPTPTCSLRLFLSVLIIFTFFIFPFLSSLSFLHHFPFFSTFLHLLGFLSFSCILLCLLLSLLAFLLHHLGKTLPWAVLVRGNYWFTGSSCCPQSSLDSHEPKPPGKYRLLKFKSQG